MSRDQVEQIPDDKAGLRIVSLPTVARSVDPDRGQPRAGCAPDVATEAVTHENDLRPGRVERRDGLVKQLARRLDARSVRGKHGSREAIEHPGPRKFLEPESLAGQNVRDQTEPVPGGQAGYRPCVRVGDASQFMRRDDALQELQLRVRQVTAGGELAERFRYPGEGVA